MDLDHVAKIAMSLPGVTETDKYRGWRNWEVDGKSFAWERPYTKADLRRFGDQQPPSEPIVAIRTAGIAEKEALLATSSLSVFDIAHFNDFAAVLIELKSVAPNELREILVDGWTAMASKKRIEEHERDRRAV